MFNTFPRRAAMMTPEDFREVLIETRLTQGDVARLFALNPRTVRRYASGELEVPRAIEVALKLIHRWRLTTKELTDL